jgi:uncharacterized protein
MNHAITIEKTEDYVKQKLQGDGTGHDWWHVDNVRKNAMLIGKEEGADLFVVELAALLHDIADWKFQDGDESVGPRLTREILESLEVDSQVIQHVCDIVGHVSFKGAGAENKISTLEGKVVQDADRLEALGAIGIARCFAYGGHKNRPIYDPSIKPTTHDDFSSYKKNQSHSMNHFYEKLLLLKDRMNTATGKRIAEGRHKFTEQFLGQFFKEWNGGE